MENSNILADKASRLFQFLADLQALKEKPVRTVKDYGDESHWVPIRQLSDVSASTPLQVRFEPELAIYLELPTDASRTSDGSLIEIKRPAAPPALSIPDSLEKVIIWPKKSLLRRPEIADLDEAGREISTELRAEAEDWLQHWDNWAPAARAEEMYQVLFDMQVKARQQADEFELVLGAGWLAWELEPNETVDRPIFFLSLDIEMDKATGSIVIRESGAQFTAELEALPAHHMGDGRFVEDLKARVADFEGRLVNLDEFNELAQFTVNGLSTQARYEPSLERVRSDGRPVLSWAPTVILRPRQRVGLSGTFRSIASEIEEQQAIPTGLRPLVDPGFESDVTPSGKPGALFEVGGEIYSPLPLNDRQRRVVEHVDSNAHTIVQGPPGTGKTHMAAALLSHLLAQGQRVLVTAQTERALYELRGKLPAEIRELAVSVIGSSSREMTDLRTAIETIQRKSSSFDEGESNRRVASLERELDALRENRVQAVRRWAAELENEQRSAGLTGYTAPLAEVILKVEEEKPQYEWIEELSLADQNKPFPLTPGQIYELLELLADETVTSRPPYEGNAVLDPAKFSTATQFDQALQAAENAASHASEARHEADGKYLSIWQGLDTTERNRAEIAASDAIEARRHLGEFPTQWAETVHSDTPKHERANWEESRQVLLQKLSDLGGNLDRVRDVQRITVEGEFDAFVPMAQSLSQYLASGKTLNVRPDGSVKPPMFGGGTVKAALPFLSAVRINGMPPTTLELVETYLAYVSIMWELQAIQNQWPFTALGTTDPSGSVRTLETDLDRFGHYLQTIRETARARETLAQLGFPAEFKEIESLQAQFPLLARAEEAQRAAGAADAQFVRVGGKDRLANYRGPVHPWIRSLSSAIENRDPDQYGNALREGADYHRIGLQRQRLDELLRAVRTWSNQLATYLESGDSGDVWADRMPYAESARRWLVARNYVLSKASHQREDIQAELERTDRRIHDALSSLAAERAWAAAVGSSRIDGAMRATMEAYAQAVRRLGKGTGKYANQHRRDVRRHLDSAREAVPVWIMPIYKVVEQFDLAQNMFDVVIVDEASQAGVESVFLQYLAPKVVVVGDDHQVSPAGVGDNLERLRKIARQYLYDFDKVDAWVDPKRSLFDDANMRYGGRIALDEHRRCVPEIIEFSNEIVYRPNNIELKPVREVAGERLAPFRLTRTPNAFEKGKSKKINQIEADVLITRLIGVLEDPEYDGKTIGVISLLSSSGQAEYIQSRLVTELPPHVWEERDLKVGVPAAFQGAERDVIFLSMVTPVPHGSRLSAVTRADSEQRYNVAVSRAKDQVWLFHSVGIDDFSNKDDYRFKLLEYAYRVAEAAPESRTSQPVPTDKLVEPFDSLFEQRVYNELVRRGYYVIPQFDAFGRRIDLVVQGSEGRLAVECDGDYWHSEEFAVADQARQRELERLGWVFIRIFESDFYLDPEEQIQRVVNRLEELGIRPGYVAGHDTAERQNVEIIESVSELPEAQDAESDLGIVPEPVEASEAVQTVVEEHPIAVQTVVEQPIKDHPVKGTAPSGQIELYEEFEGSTVSVYVAGKDQVDQGLLDIIRVEGPISREMLFQRYVKAGGDSRVRDHARDVLRPGLLRLLKRGEITQCGDEPLMYKAGDQPDVRPRTRGPRTVGDIPHIEWVAHMHAVMDANPELEGEELLRATMHRVGYRKFTDNIKAILSAVRKDIG